MKSASCFIYVLLTLLYCKFADGTMFWYGLGQLTILLFICVLCYFVFDHKFTSEVERLFLKYVCYMTLGRAIYTLKCTFMGDPWVVHNTDIFVFISGATLAVFLLHVLYKYTHAK